MDCCRSRAASTFIHFVQIVRMTARNDLISGSSIGILNRDPLEGSSIGIPYRDFLRHQYTFAWRHYNRGCHILEM